MASNSEVEFDDEFPMDGSMIKEIRKEIKDDIEYNFRRIA